MEENPRSIKRLINSLALIKILNDKDSGDKSDGVLTDKDTAMVMFAMVCLQIAHPEIYQLFADNPNFREWNEELAYRETQKRKKQMKIGRKILLKLLKQTTSMKIGKNAYLESVI